MFEPNNRNIFSLFQSNVAVIGLFRDLGINEADVFTEFADNNMKLSFGITKSEQIFQLLRNKSNLIFHSSNSTLFNQILKCKIFFSVQVEIKV